MSKNSNPLCVHSHEMNVRPGDEPWDESMRWTGATSVQEMNVSWIREMNRCHRFQEMNSGQNSGDEGCPKMSSFWKPGDERFFFGATPCQEMNRVTISWDERAYEMNTARWTHEKRCVRDEHNNKRWTQTLSCSRGKLRSQLNPNFEFEYANKE